MRWKYQRYMHDYLGCVKAVDESVGRLLKFLDDEEAGRQHDRRLCLGPGLLPGRARLVRQALDFRGIAAHAAAGPLAGVTSPGSVNNDIVSTLDFAETFLDAAGVADPGRDAGPQPASALLPGQTPADWRKSLYYHYYEFPAPHRVARITAS